ncbi:hypothetical protein NBRC116583_04280 [Arenicella sp. 4NH20-0111]|uniref:chemotaxis protein CheW n=1 Tax=Arenicella sp. 4NH20-0111 TaxID=3127648 RepID=UPI00310C5E2D
MSSQKLDCYILPSSPNPLLLPIECVAEVVAKPVIENLTKAPAQWMQGHVNWRNQRLPVMDYEGLHTFASPDEEKTVTEKSAGDELLVVLNPIPGAARKAYSALLCRGNVQQISVEPNLEFADMPEGLDKRYVDGVIDIESQQFIVPKLTAIAVAFTYF